ncbi:hypothetical protein VDR72_05665, partial [Xanthomonas campestris pv. campestris]|nr:hypothetical protein [Xanthomonas campestris]MEB1025200.1 hypothetical protein [Xanthomonas campestris pv. campestris]MEB1133717.1 hypothetical protein [Xanthomonas campestris pv. campestris]MEB1653434.1 hypothetical protein [Xanthomonas campestris pv. campestris]MEB1862295.1 hypothetical protein [Xanthomonas campestris pv. campestris]
SVAWITPQHEAGSVAYLWCVVQSFPKDVRLSKSAVDQIKIDFSCELAEKKFRDFSAFPVYRGYFSDLSPVVKYLVSRGK